jgi:hypothetical protein
LCVVVISGTLIVTGCPLPYIPQFTESNKEYHPYNPCNTKKASGIWEIDDLERVNNKSIQLISVVNGLDPSVTLKLELANDDTRKGLGVSIAFVSVLTLNTITLCAEGSVTELVVGIAVYGLEVVGGGGVDAAVSFANIRFIYSGPLFEVPYNDWGKYAPLPPNCVAVTTFDEQRNALAVFAKYILFILASFAFISVVIDSSILKS